MSSDRPTDDMSSATSEGNMSPTSEGSEEILLVRHVLLAFRVQFSLVFIITLVGLIANAFVLYVILRSQRLRNTVYNVYIISLCLSSFILLLVWGLTDSIILGHYLHNREFLILTDLKIRKVVLGLEVSTMVINCLMITALAVDRYIVVARPASLQKRRTVKNALICCTIVWGVGLLSACAAIPIDLYTPLETWYALSIILFVITFAVPLVIIAVCFGLTVRAARRNSSTLAPTGRRKLGRQTRFLALIGGVSLSFFICWGYWHSYYLAMWPLIRSGGFYRGHILVRISLHMLTDDLALFNTALNPFLYALNRPHIKRHLAGFFPCGRKSTPRVEMMPDDMESTEANSLTHSGGRVAYSVEKEAVSEKLPDSPNVN